MAKSGGSGGRGGSGGSEGRNAGVPAANATDGRTRMIAGKTFNTADVVNRALDEARDAKLDLDTARSELQRINPNASSELVKDYAVQTTVLSSMERTTGANVTGQIGKWDFTSAQSIHRSFNSYLDRRISGQRARWTESKKIIR